MSPDNSGFHNSSRGSTFREDGSMNNMAKYVRQNSRRDTEEYHTNSSEFDFTKGSSFSKIDPEAYKKGNVIYANPYKEVYQCLDSTTGKLHVCKCYKIPFKVFYG